MLFPRIFLLLSSKLFKSAYHAETGVARFNDIVNISVTCCVVWVAEQVVVFGYLLLFDFSTKHIIFNRLELFRI